MAGSLLSLLPCCSQERQEYPAGARLGWAGNAAASAAAGICSTAPSHAAANHPGPTLLLAAAALQPAPLHARDTPGLVQLQLGLLCCSLPRDSPAPGVQPDVCSAAFTCLQHLWMWFSRLAASGISREAAPWRFWRAFEQCFKPRRLSLCVCIYIYI